MEIQDVNERVKEQEQFYNDITRLLVNMKKDSSSRQTQQYLNDRLSRLEDIFKQAQTNHVQLKNQEILSTHKYITINYFDNYIQKKYDETMEFLRNLEKRLQVVQQLYEPKDVLYEDTIDEKREHSPKLFIQNFRIMQFTKKLSQAKMAITENKPIWHIQSLLQVIQNQWQEIENNHLELLIHQNTFELSYFKDNCFDQIQKDYEITTELIQEKLYESRPTVNSIIPKTSGKLPQIKIPVFTGDYNSWNTFQDLFTKIIHEDNSISYTEKMQYLKSHVQGEAAKLIQYLPISESNYKTAWELLTKRYDDRRMIATKFIDRLIDLPTIRRANSAQLRDMHDTLRECLEALKNQGINTTSWSLIMIRLVTRKWDVETNIKYESQIEESTKIQDFEDMMKFLEKRFKSLETTLYSSTSNNQNNQLNYQNKLTPQFEQRKECWYCSSRDHHIQICPKFKALDVMERLKTVTDKQMCKRCLNHSATKQCLSVKFVKCEVCQRPGHHALLHRSYNASIKENKRSEDNDIKKTYASTSSYSKPAIKKMLQSNVLEMNSRQNVLLATALVQTTTNDGVPQFLRVLCDQGSEASFCTEEVAQRLAYPRTKICAEIRGIGDETPKTSNCTVNLNLQPRLSSDYSLWVTLIVLPKLTSSLPRQDLQQFQEQCLQNKLIADPTYYKKGPIDIILGAQEYSKILREGFEKIQDGIIAQNTEFGWILSGLCSTYINTGIKVLSMTVRTEEIQQLTKFWELEEVSETNILNAEDEICEKYYKDTTKRSQDGTYTVRLPFKNPQLEYGESRQRAGARLLQLERQFKKNTTLQTQYHEFMHEYIKMGHMRQVPREDYNKGKYYIPHQAVIREDSLTTKLRVVFDASSKTSLKISLNDNLYKGPRLQQDLATILLRWRTHKIAIMADIMKMYRFIKIHDKDMTNQRILWRFHPDQLMKEYELTTVTYGTTSAPYLAVRTLQQLALDEKDKYPMASQVTLNDFFVDDILSGQDDLQTTKELQKQLIAMLKKGGFMLRKWSSNSAELLKNIPNDNKDDTLLKLPLEENRKSLGVAWSPSEDNFYFKIIVTENKKPTKRFILSEVAKIFDPLGWLAPIIITLKLLVQELWTNGTDWDQVINEQKSKQWNKIQYQLKSIENIKINRWCHVTKNVNIELHGFSDASEKAYGAVVYCRVKCNDRYYVTLLQAKSKVAPKKHKATLPRLELCSTLLLSKLMKTICEALNKPNITIYCWTDSMITLGWIRGEADRWQTFVANRVSEIKHLLPNSHWNHVVSEDNPADVISRGIEPQKLETYTLWWNGPRWLTNEKLPITKTVPEICTEIKQSYSATLSKKEPNDVWERFSELKHMIRVLSYCYRFRNKQRTNQTLSVDENNKTTIRIIKTIQEEAFSQEIQLLQKQQVIKKGSKLSSLDPFIDSDGLLRVGGRLQNSQLPYNQKHPILLPYDHYVTSLIINDAHLKTLHGGNKLTLSYLRQKYWIISGKRKVKSVINKCVKCIRYKAKTASQKMGILPKPRVTVSHPFSHTGVDFAGPIQIRSMKGRGHKSCKAYIAVFVCLSTKAIHLELVGDLSTETFIAALRRFMARRGHVSDMYSECATNFVGTANLLYKEILEITQSPNFQNTMTNIGMNWHFIPPSSPHFGGIWESGVKSMKHHLRRVVGDSTLTYEEMTTMLHQIEACLNSRPLCPLSEDINDNTILTPSHFLIGREAVGVPDPITNTNTNLGTRWKLIQKMKKDFWNSWIKDYLHQLQQRYKWKQNYENLKIGTAVIIKDTNISPSKWPLAKVKEVHPGNDDAIRVVTLQKSNRTILKRSVHTLIPLPIHEDYDDVIQSSSSANQTPIQSHIATNDKRTKQYAIKSKAFNLVQFLLMLLLFIIGTTAKNNLNMKYTIKNIDQGLYIEQIGTATIDRGSFRIETTYDRAYMKQQFDKISTVTTQFKKLCHQSQTVTYETHCDEFHQHLEEEQHKFERTIQYLTSIEHTRKKRGLLGNFLTSIFGVNDEAYRDINTLQDNQRVLIQATNQQTKFMISTITTVNQTEDRIQKKLQKFQTKLNKAIEFMNNNNVWYRSIDGNRIKIQVMQTYHLAVNYISEIMDHYDNLLKIFLDNASIYNVLSPEQVGNIINSANKKMPHNLRITQTQLLSTRITENSTHIQVFAHFPIHDVTKYVLVHVTPVPIKIKDNSFQSVIIQHTFMGFDYNNEHYIELTHDEFNNCIRKDINFICSPVAVKNMQYNRNCIVEQLFKSKANNQTQCLSKIYKITSDVIWKQMYMTNTWLFICKDTVTASIICDGQREEVNIRNVGVLRISENCVIKTMNNVLSAKRTEKVSVLESFIKSFNFSMNSKITSLNIEDISKEKIIDSSKDSFQHLINSELNLQTQLDNTVWAQIQSHAYLASFITTISLLFLAALILCYGPQILTWVRTNIPCRRSKIHLQEKVYSIPHRVHERASKGPPPKPLRRPAAEAELPTENIELYQLDSRILEAPGCSNDL